MFYVLCSANEQLIECVFLWHDGLSFPSMIHTLTPPCQRVVGLVGRQAATAGRHPPGHVGMRRDAESGHTHLHV